MSTQEIPETVSPEEVEELQPDDGGEGNDDGSGDDDGSSPPQEAEPAGEDVARMTREERLARCRQEVSVILQRYRCDIVATVGEPEVYGRSRHKLQVEASAGFVPLD